MSHVDPSLNDRARRRPADGKTANERRGPRANPDGERDQYLGILKALFDDAPPRTYERGRHIFFQGDPFAGIFRVESGLIGLRRISENGESMMTMLVMPGDFIGFDTLAGDSTYSVSAEALIESRITSIPASVARACIDANPSLGMACLRIAVDRLNALQDKVFHLASRPAHLRLAHLLFLLADRSGEARSDGPHSFDLLISHRDVADLLGVRMETLSRAIGRLRSLELADYDGRRVLIPDQARLEQVLYNNGSNDN